MKLKLSSDNGIVELAMMDESAKTVASAQCEVLHFCEQITNMFGTSVSKIIHGLNDKTYNEFFGICLWLFHWARCENCARLITHFR